MGYSSIAIGLGLGGGKSATSNGRSNVAKETFTTATLSTTDSYALSVNDTYTLTVRPSAVIGAGDSISIVGLTSSTTSDNGSLTVAGTNAAVFGSSGAWTQSSGALVLTVAGGQSIPTGSDTVITFVLANPSSVTGGVSSVTLTSSGFSTSSLTGTFLKGVATYNITTRDTEANILASTPSNPSGEVTNAYGTDTYDLYVYDGSAWYIYNNDTPVSVSFDGTDDSIAISSTPTYITQSSAFSLSFWMNPSGYGSNGTYANVLALKSDFNSKNFAIHINNNTAGYAGISFGITDYSTNTAFYHTTGVTGNTLLNTWSHVVITYDGSGLGTIGNWKLYINGSSKTIGTGGGWFDSCTPINTIGNYRSYHYEGLIDELAVFNSELSSSNVTSIYNSGSPTDISSFSPVGWWRMGDGTEAGSGTTIYDMSSNSNNGTLTNGPTFSTDVP